MALQSVNWTCPFCHRDQVVTKDQNWYEASKIYIQSHKYGEVGCAFLAIGCANADCGEITLKAYFGPGEMQNRYSRAEFVFEEEYNKPFDLLPSSSAKPQPPSVPTHLANDYYEACAILNLSPKASATLSRRVLQGAIRDFCGIKDATLFKEIDALEQASNKGHAPQGVTIEVVKAMHHVRSIGNIGAHMEKDTNVIVDVDPSEAQALINLIEMLFKEWYVARQSRLDQLAALQAVADQKAAAKKAPPSKPSGPD
jgi:hypothetical protein